MFVGLLFLCYLLLALNLTFAEQARSGTLSLRKALLGASVIWGVLLTFFTEVLSLFSALTFWQLVLCWAVASLVVLVLVFRRITPKLDEHVHTLKAALQAPLQGASGSPITFVAAGVVVLIAAVRALVAWVAPPNNWDAMAYHLARVVHWIQQSTIAFFPTNDMRQLFDPPWAEYALFHLQVLSGGDHLANFVQWFSMVGSCIGVSLIARQLGAESRGQVFAALFAATIPMGILQSSSPQNDYVTAFWLVCAVYFMLEFRSTSRLVDALMLGASAGLAVLTKGTAYIYVSIPLIWLGMWAWQRFKWQAWRLVFVIGTVALAVNVGFMLQNVRLFSSPLGPNGANYANQTFAPNALMCNVVRDITLELGTSDVHLNMAIAQGATTACTALGVDVSDPRITWRGEDGSLHIPFRVAAQNTYQGTAQNPLHFALILALCLFILVISRLRHEQALLNYGAMLVGMLLLYAAYVRWQPWGSRLLLAPFVLAAPLFGVVVWRIVAARFVAPLLALLLIVGAIPALLLDQNAPLVGTHTIFVTPRNDQYYVANIGLDVPYSSATKMIVVSGCREVGFVADVEGWEYPLHVLFTQQHADVRMEHVAVENVTAKLSTQRSYASFQPCAVLTVAPREMTFLTLGEQQYSVAFTNGPVTVLMPVTR